MQKRTVDVSERAKRFLSALINKDRTNHIIKEINISYGYNHYDKPEVYISVNLRDAYFLPKLHEIQYFNLLTELFLEEQGEKNFCKISFTAPNIDGD